MFVHINNFLFHSYTVIKSKIDINVARRCATKIPLLYTDDIMNQEFLFILITAQKNNMHKNHRHLEVVFKSIRRLSSNNKMQTPNMKVQFAQVCSG